jgi:hypothetical protein
MQRVAALLGATLLLWASGWTQPTLLIFADPAPPVQHDGQPYDPNIDLKPHLTPFLQELRKVRVEWYAPNHSIARQFGEQRGLSAEQLANPTPALRGQLARAWGAEFVMTVRCTRAPTQTSYEYAIKVWRLGVRAPVWETEGFQQVATRQGRLGRHDRAADSGAHRRDALGRGAMGHPAAPRRAGADARALRPRARSRPRPTLSRARSPSSCCARASSPRRCPTCALP